MLNWRNYLLDISIINEAPAPILPALGGLNQRMPFGMKMRARMAVLRRVAAAHMPTRQAQAQMHPRIAHLQTLLATLGPRLHLLQVFRNVTAY
jgi:hypothetical protein